MTVQKEIIWKRHVCLTYYHAFIITFNAFIASSIYEHAVATIIGLLPGMAIGISSWLIFDMWFDNRKTFVKDVQAPVKHLVTYLIEKMSKKNA